MRPVAAIVADVFGPNGFFLGSDVLAWDTTRPQEMQVPISSRYPRVGHPQVVRDWDCRTLG